MKKIVLIILTFILVSCTGKTYEEWQIPLESVDKAYIYNYYYDPTEPVEITKEEANQLLETFNNLNTLDDITDGDFGIGFYGTIRFDFVKGNKKYCLANDGFAFNVHRDDKVIFFITLNFNQKFFDILLNLCDKYSIKTSNMCPDGDVGFEIEDKFTWISGSAHMKDVLEVQGLEFNEDLTMDEFLKDKIEIKLGNKYQYEGITFLVYKIEEGNVHTVIAYKE